MFANNYRHGEGVYTYANGDCFIGSYFKSKKHGPCKSTYPNGDWLTATFEHDDLEGTIHYNFLNGDTLSGDYSAGQPVGDVTVTLKQRSATHTFPWPVGANTVPVLALAARLHAMSLPSKLCVASAPVMLDACDRS
jgi:hypothetical protein